MQKKIFVNSINFLADSYIASYYRFLKCSLYSIFSTSFNPLYALINHKIICNKKIYQLKLPVELFLYSNSSKFFFPKQNCTGSTELDLTYYAIFYIECQYFLNIKSVKVSRNLKICEFPFLTNNGYFVFDGCERIIINQITKNPGVYFFNKIKKKTYIFSPYIISSYGKSLSIFSIPKLRYNLEEIKNYSRASFIKVKKSLFKKKEPFNKKVKIFQTYKIKNNLLATNFLCENELSIFLKNKNNKNNSWLHNKKIDSNLVRARLKKDFKNSQFLKDFILQFDSVSTYSTQKSCLYFNENFYYNNDKSFCFQDLYLNELDYITYQILQNFLKFNFNIKQIEKTQNLIKKDIRRFQILLLFNKNLGGLHIGKSGRFQVNNKLGLKLSSNILYITCFDLDRIYLLNRKKLNSLFLRKQDTLDSLINKKFQSSGDLLTQKLTTAINFLYKQYLAKNIEYNEYRYR
jgi:DNA-directed RNA polymerase beta subunit